MTEQENKELGEWIKSIERDPNVIEKIYDRTKKAASSVARLYLKYPYDIEDALSESYCTIVRKAPLFLRNKNAYSWVLKIVQNTSINLSKKLQRERTDELNESVFSDSDNLIEQTEDKILIEKCLAELTQEEQCVVICTYYGGMSLSETGKVIGRGKSSVKMILDRAEKNLREFSKKYMTD